MIQFSRLNFSTEQDTQMIKQWHYYMLQKVHDKTSQLVQYWAPVSRKNTSATQNLKLRWSGSLYFPLILTGTQFFGKSLKLQNTSYQFHTISKQVFWDIPNLIPNSH